MAKVTIHHDKTTPTIVTKKTLKKDKKTTRRQEHIGLKGYTKDPT